MEKKYYFRGLGLGMIVTAVIMGIALSGGRKELTDEEVIARAKALGMTENTRLLEPAAAEESPTDTEKPNTETPEAGKQTAEKPASEQTPETEKPAEKEPAKDVAVTQPKAGEEELPKKEEKKAGADTNEMTKQDEDTEQEKPSEDVSSGQKASAGNVTIVSGDGSFTVAKKLEEAGFVSSASAFDDFLCQNGYDKRLRTGTFQIPAGADEEQIARIVTGE